MRNGYPALDIPDSIRTPKRLGSFEKCGSPFAKSKGVGRGGCRPHGWGTGSVNREDCDRFPREVEPSEKARPNRGSLRAATSVLCRHREVARHALLAERSLERGNPSQIMILSEMPACPEEYRTRLGPPTRPEREEASRGSRSSCRCSCRRLGPYFRKDRSWDR